MRISRSLLFDTQAVVLWATNKGMPKAVIDRVDQGYSIYLSVVSLWEFILKGAKHNFGIDYGQLLNTIEAMQAEIIPIRKDHLETLRTLPSFGKHTDPFDRLIISQAIRDRLVLVGGDRQFAAYQAVRPLQILWDN